MGSSDIQTRWGLPAPKVIELKEYEKAKYPDLRQGMDVLVIRPFQLMSPLCTWLGWNIRWAESRISGDLIKQMSRWEALRDKSLPSHAMTYVGMGRCASQDSEFRFVHLREYKGCILLFVDNDWSMADRYFLMAECCKHAGDKYAYGDIMGLFLFALTQDEKYMSTVKDDKAWFCSESCCALKQKVQPSWFKGIDPRKVTPLLYLQLALIEKLPILPIVFK